MVEIDHEIITKQTTFDELINKLRDFKEGSKIDKIWFYIYDYYTKDDKWKYKLEEAIKALNYKNKPEGNLWLWLLIF